MGSLTRPALGALPRLALLGLLAAVAAGGTGALGACGSDGDGNAAPSDAGLIDSFPGDVAARPETSGATRRAARLTVVNATHDLGPEARVGGTDGTAPVRLCFLVGSRPGQLVVAPQPPLPARVAPTGTSGLAGIEQGSAATLEDTGIAYADRYLVPLVVSARAVDPSGNGDPSPGCPDIIDSVVQENVDYWRLPTIPPGTLADGASYLLTLTGCTATARTPNPGKCGPGFAPSLAGGPGNLALTIHDTGGPPPPPDALGVRFLHVSTAAQAVLAARGELARVQPAVRDDASGDLRRIAPAATPTGVLHPLVALPDVGPLDALVFGTGTGADREALYPRTLQAIAQQTNGPSGALPFVPGLTFVFVALGDPDTAEAPAIDRNGRPNLRAFHYLGLPAAPAAVP